MQKELIKETYSWYDRHFKEFEESLNGSSGGVLHRYKQKAFEVFKKVGFPTPKEEAWKYTNLQSILKSDFQLATKVTEVDPEKINSVLVGEDRLVFVFLNGFYSQELSKTCSNMEIPQGLIVESLAQVLKSNCAEKALSKLGTAGTGEPLVDFNTALFQDGLYLSISENISIDSPVQLVFLTTGEQKKLVSHPRLIVEAEKGSKVELLEHHIGPDMGEYISCSVGQIFAEAGSQVSHVKIQQDSMEACHLSTLKIEQKERSKVQSYIFSFGGKLVRNEVYPILNGTHGEAVINGLSVLSGEQHVDNYTLIDHALPECESHELFKGVYAGKSRGVFGGTIIVREDAQKTNAIQSNKSILLSDDASVETRPQLKIWADDVKCTHGATVGQLDEEAMFYLMSRGINKDIATQILVDAFATDVIDNLTNEALVSHLKDLLRQRLAEIAG